MEVTLRLKMRENPPTVYITANEVTTNPLVVTDWINSLRVARTWLQHRYVKTSVKETTPK